MPHSRLPRLAAWLYWLSVLSLVLLPLVLITAAFFPEALGNQSSAFARLPDSPWPLNAWAGFVVFLFPQVFVMLALNAMRKLFAVYRSGDPLAPQTGPLIRAIGANLLAAAVLGVALGPLQTGLISSSNPPGERFVSVSVSSGDIGFILVAGLLLLIGWSMVEASKIAAENKEFV